MATLEELAACREKLVKYEKLITSMSEEAEKDKNNIRELNLQQDRLKKELEALKEPKDWKKELDRYKCVNKALNDKIKHLEREAKIDKVAQLEEHKTEMKTGLPVKTENDQPTKEQLQELIASLGKELETSRREITNELEEHKMERKTCLPVKPENDQPIIQELIASLGKELETSQREITNETCTQDLKKTVEESRVCLAEHDARRSLNTAHGKYSSGSLLTTESPDYLTFLNLPDPVKNMTSQIATPLPFDYSMPSAFGNTESSTNAPDILHDVTKGPDHYTEEERISLPMKEDGVTKPAPDLNCTELMEKSDSNMESDDTSRNNVDLVQDDQVNTLHPNSETPEKAAKQSEDFSYEWMDGQIDLLPTPPGFSEMREKAAQHSGDFSYEWLDRQIDLLPTPPSFSYDSDPNAGRWYRKRSEDSQKKNRSRKKDRKRKK